MIGSSRGARGGAFVHHGGSLSKRPRYYHDPTYEDYLTGFRVSQVPEPATIVILALASVGVLRRRRAQGIVRCG